MVELLSGLESQLYDRSPVLIKSDVSTCTHNKMEKKENMKVISISMLFLEHALKIPHSFCWQILALRAIRARMTKLTKSDDVFFCDKKIKRTQKETKRNTKVY